MTSHHETQHLPITHVRWMRVLSCLALVTALLVGSSAFDAAPAMAQGLRTQVPIVAGTRVGVPGMRQCTVGAVLRATGLLSNLTQYSRGIRYLLIAKHCAQSGAEVTVGDRVVGSVVWTAADDDLELVRVDPDHRRRLACSGASQLHRCITVESVTPRALGRVVLDTPSGPAAVPMQAGGTPTDAERFCTSGSSTKVNCSWSRRPTPDRGYSPGEAAAGHAQGVGVIVGDSGGPVVSTTGAFYGIIVTRGIGPNMGLMGYIPAARVEGALGRGYALASAG